MQKINEQFHLNVLNFDTIKSLNDNKQFEISSYFSLIDSKNKDLSILHFKIVFFAEEKPKIEFKESCEKELIKLGIEKEVRVCIFKELSEVLKNIELKLNLLLSFLNNDHHVFKKYRFIIETEGLDEFQKVVLVNGKNEKIFSFVCNLELGIMLNFHMHDCNPENNSNFQFIKIKFYKFQTFNLKDLHPSLKLKFLFLEK